MNIKSICLVLTIIFVVCIFPKQITYASNTKDSLKKVTQTGTTAVLLNKIKTLKGAKPNIKTLSNGEIPKSKKELKKLQKKKNAEKKQITNSAFEKVRVMAESGDVQAQYIIGYAYYTGQQVEENENQALLWWKKAANSGHYDADAYIGYFYENGIAGLPKHEGEAVRRYKRAIANGSSMAEVLLGMMDYQNKNLENKRLAVKMFQSAATKGNLLAKNIEQEIVQKGIENKQNLKKDFNIEKESKKVALVTLYTQAGLNAFKGQIVAQDNHKAVTWWQIAADQDDARAQALLGTAYYTGRGKNQDYKKAIEYLKVAAEKKDGLAAYTLGKAYLEGNGVRKNKEKAAQYLELASKQGIVGAEKLLLDCHLEE